MTNSLSFCKVEKCKPGKPDKLVVLLHGYGADGENLIGLSNELSFVLWNSIFVSPNAPFECEIGSGLQWFGLHGRNPGQIYHDITMVTTVLKEFIHKQLEQYKLLHENLILIGFSQGAMLAMHYAISSIEKMFAVVSFSGTLVESQTLFANCPTINQTPFCLINGSDDEIVPVEYGMNSYRKMRDEHLNCQFHKINGLAHSIDHRAIATANKFLRNITQHNNS